MSIPNYWHSCDYLVKWMKVLLEWRSSSEECSINPTTCTSQMVKWVLGTQEVRHFLLTFSLSIHVNVSVTFVVNGDPPGCWWWVESSTAMSVDIHGRWLDAQLTELVNVWNLRTCRLLAYAQCLTRTASFPEVLQTGIERFVIITTSDLPSVGKVVDKRSCGLLSQGCCPQAHL